MSPKYRVLIVLLMLALHISASGSMAQNKITITWFIGLGAGLQPEQLIVQDAIVRAFNIANPDIELTTFMTESVPAPDTFSMLISSNNTPDIVGPMGARSSNLFIENWLDLQPLVDATGYDLSQFPPASVDFYRTVNGLEGLPFILYPSALFFNRELFNQAGLNYPPQEFGAPYIMPNGEAIEWNWDTLAQVAKLLTIDATGANATEAHFNPDRIVQFGFINQWNDTRNELSIFGSHTLWDAESRIFSLPDNFHQATHWIYNAIWNEHFMPNLFYSTSDRLDGNEFASSNVAMARAHLWYTCCIDNAQFWDLAFLPTHNGVYTATLHADTFSISHTTAHPEAAFRVLTYLVGKASPELIAVYGGMPAREGARADFFANLNTRYPQGVKWAILEESVNYPDIPSSESWYPSFERGQRRFGDFQALLKSDPNLDIDVELERLEADLIAIIAED